MWLQALVCSLVFLAPACVAPAAAFLCTESAQCGAGICQPTGVCSFDDTSCDSGQRYGAASGDPHDRCVSVDPPTCDLAQPFGKPVLVAGLESGTEDASLRLSLDEKTAYFFSARGASNGKKLLYTATRPAVLGRFSVPVKLANVNTDTQYGPSVTGLGLDLFFASYRNNGNDIYQASRTSPSDPFTDVRLVTGINSSASEVQPYVTHEGTTIYFVRDDTAVFRGTGDVKNGYSDPKPLSEINTSGTDADPVPSGDELTLYWASVRPGGPGDLDIWEAHRTSKDMPFGDFALVRNVNSKALDAPSDVSKDGCRLYLTSASSGRIAIYVASRPVSSASAR